MLDNTAEEVQGRGVKKRAVLRSPKMDTVHTHTHKIAKHSTTIVAECESSSLGVKQKECSTPMGVFLEEADVHTHNENHKQEQSKKSGERKLLRSCRAALDAFRAVGKRSDVQLRSSGAVIQIPPVPSPNPHPATPTNR